MNTEYAVGRFGMHFESRARRRWLVVLVYVSLAMFDLVWIPSQGRDWFHEHARWLAFAILVVFLALNPVFSRLTDDMRRRGDERETHRRAQAYTRAYHVLGGFFAAAFFASYLIQGPSPITPRLLIAWQAYLAELPLVLLVAMVIVYGTLPQAILLWTEPDMEKLS